MQNIYLFGFATFGHPNDYRQSPFKLDNRDIAKNVKIFDLPNAIKVFPNSTLYAIRKENIGGVTGVSYAIYTFANEMTSMRDGTFIGSSILFTNEIAEENTTISKLNQFHSLLVSNNTQNDVLQVNHSSQFQIEKKLSEEYYQDFEKMANQLKPIPDIDNFSSSNFNLVVGSRTDENTLTSSFKKALLLLNKYDTVYFSSSREIIDYCKNRNIYPITDEKGFEQEIEDIKYEKQLKVLSSISEFEQEKQKLQLDKENVIADLKSQLEKSKIAHSENESLLIASESNVEKIKSFYIEFSLKLDDYSNQLKSGGKLEDVRRLYNENKRIFIDSVVNLKQPQFVKKLNQITAVSGLKQDYNYKPQTQYTQSYHQSNNYQSNPHEQEDGQHRSRKINYYKIYTLFFALLWILSMVYFLVFIKVPQSEAETVTEHTQTQAPQQEPPKQPELIPSPNSFLSENDLKLVIREGLKSKTPEQIVEIIFAKNPTDVASHYDTQKDIYKQVLISRNTACFRNNLCICDTLSKIPSYKK